MEWAERVRSYRRAEPPRRARSRGVIAGWFGGGRYAILEGMGHSALTSMLLMNTLAFFDREVWRTWPYPTRNHGAVARALDDQVFIRNTQRARHFLLGPATGWERKTVDANLHYLNGDASVGLFREGENTWRTVRMRDRNVLRSFSRLEAMDDVRLVWRTEEKGPYAWSTYAGTEPPRTTTCVMPSRGGQMLDDGRIFDRFRLCDLERDEVVEMFEPGKAPLFRSRAFGRGIDAHISMDGNALVGVVERAKNDLHAIRIPIAPSLGARNLRRFRGSWHPSADLAIVGRRVLTSNDETVLELDADPIGWTHDGAGIFARREEHLELWS